MTHRDDLESVAGLGIATAIGGAVKSRRLDQNRVGTNTYGQNIHPTQFPDQHLRFNSCRQPRAKPLDQNLNLRQQKPQPKPTQLTAAPVNTISSLPKAPWRKHCASRRLGFLTNRDSPYQRTVPGGTWGLGPRVQLTISDMCRAVARKLGRLKASNPIA